MSRASGVDASAWATKIWFTTEAPAQWTEQAACRSDPQVAGMFTDAQSLAEVNIALNTCATCPVRAQCLNLGERLSASGVWGGRVLRHGAAVPTLSDGPAPR